MKVSAIANMFPLKSIEDLLIATAVFNINRGLDSPSFSIKSDESEEDIRRFLEGLDFSHIESVAKTLAEISDGCLDWNQWDCEDNTDNIMEMFDKRDRLKMILIGAELLCPDWQMSKKQQKSVDFFETKVRPILWKLTHVCGDDDENTTFDLWRDPDIPSAESMVDAVNYLHAYPEAKSYFEALMKCKSEDRGVWLGCIEAYSKQDLDNLMEGEEMMPVEDGNKEA